MKVRSKDETSGEGRKERPEEKGKSKHSRCNEWKRKMVRRGKRRSCDGWKNTRGMERKDEMEKKNEGTKHRTWIGNKIALDLIKGQWRKV